MLYRSASVFAFLLSFLVVCVIDTSIIIRYYLRYRYIRI